MLLSHRLGHEEEPEQGDEEEAAREYEEGCNHEDNVIRNHVDPSLEARVAEHHDPGRLPLEDDVDDEAEEDPVETAPQHVEGVQSAQAEVEATICSVVGASPCQPHRRHWPHIGF